MRRMLTDEDALPADTMRTGLGPPAAGEVIGGVFKVRGFVADGSIAQIVSAVYDGTPRQCVLKVLLPAHASDPDTTDRFLDVARASAELDHPSIVRGLGAGEERGWVWAASELVVGENLDTYVERRARSSRDA